ncbi:hypothetical protein PTSG_06525 [Salpingoeca rosetta]|uniref:Uncharacterized protein n=1 Tax=Salpingoeca rosetta (strain ATCC 50818 / BSB-021) TaxID=946362 RepID=F2UG24_SALR5|nr:uncharacterized protein PTSG_06525 [Salpingoeca rosetta]EGD75452.1 hypothetical protein PTSG_06525 [Salpingoeca rosetta]|eukprot:XP_004991909.1 hypothetical protein PTSG_06525 [Salpingoeca rosetta]
MAGLGFPDAQQAAMNRQMPMAGSLLREAEELERKLGSKARSNQRMSPRDFFNELPAILTNFFGLSQSDSSTNMFTNKRTAACAEHLFYPEGPILSHIELIQREGKRYGLPLKFLPLFFSTKLAMEAVPHLPPIVQAMLAQPANTAKLDHLSPRPFAYFYIMYCMRALKSSERERLESSQNVYYRLLAAFLNYYVPTKDSSTSATQPPTAASAARSAGSPSLRAAGTAALQKINTATHVMTEQGFSGISNIDQIWQASAHAVQQVGGQCTRVEQTHAFLATVLEMWLGQYLLPNPSRASVTHAALVVMVVRWLQRSLFYHAHAVAHPDQHPPEHAQLIKARYSVIRGLYRHYLPAICAFVHTNLRPQHTACHQVRQPIVMVMTVVMIDGDGDALDCLLKILSPWKYTYPDKSPITREAAAEHVRAHVSFFTVLALQAVENIAHMDLGYDEAKWRRGKDASLNLLVKFLNVFPTPIAQVTVQSLISDEEEAFVTSWGRERVATALHEQLQAFDPRVLRTFAPLFFRDSARTPAQLQQAAARADKAIAASYESVSRNLQLAKEREQQHISAEITPQRLLQEPMAVINDLFNPRPALNFRAHRAYRKTLASIKSSIATLFPAAATAAAAGDRAALLRRTASGHVVQHVDRNVIRARWLAHYASMRRQPVRSFEIGFLVHILNRLSTFLNEKAAGDRAALLRRTASGHVVQHVDRNVIRARWLAHYASMRRQPVRSFEIGFLVHILNRLSTFLNEKLEHRPWLYSHLAPHQLEEYVAQHAILDDGLFGICPAHEVDPSTLFHIFVTRDGMVEADTLTATADGGITLDGHLLFADVGELVAFYRQCPYYIDRSGKEYVLKPIPHTPDENERAPTPLEATLLSLRRKLFPINLRHAADVRMWAWLLVPMLAWYLTTSVSMAAFVLLLVVFAMIVAGVVAVASTPAPHA